jgi:hypothetical protein
VISGLGVGEFGNFLGDENGLTGVFHQQAVFFLRP